MSIKFSCGCGQRLRVGDSGAARRIVCPRCGALVGVPALQSAVPGAAPPLTPEERRRSTADALTDAAPVAAELEAALQDILHDRGSSIPRVARRLLRRPAESLRHSIAAWWLCLGLGVLLTVVSVIGVLALPALLAAMPDEVAPRVVVWVLAVPLVVLLVGVPSGFLDGVLAAALAGQQSTTIVVTSPVQTALRGGLKWLGCFLAGPVVFVAVGCWYWLHCGEPGVLDWLILAEVALVGAVYWVFALLAVSDRGRLRDLNPIAVVDLAHRLGWRGQATAVVAAVAVVAHAVLLAVALGWVQEGEPPGWLLLAAGWVSALFCGALFCRMLGVRCLLTRGAGRRS